MTGMTAAQKRARIRGRVVAWIMVGFFGTAIVILNVFDIVRTGKLDHFLAGLVALIPVIAYVGLSEVVAIFRGWILQTLAMLSLGVGMMLTTTAVASVVEPVVGPWRCWFYGGVMDLPLAIGLYVIMNKPADGRDLATGPSPVARWLTRRFGDDAKGQQAAAGGPSAAPPATTQVAPVVAHSMAPPVSAQVDQRGPWAAADGPPMAHGPSGQETPENTPESAQGNAGPETQAPATSFADKTEEYKRARARYRQSVEDGNPLSDRALAKEFGYTRNWGKKRIEECEAEESRLARAQ